jgi:1,2-phenylacetyl-CoA epoxidase catalytic subunit
MKKCETCEHYEYAQPYNTCRKFKTNTEPQWSCPDHSITKAFERCFDLLKESSDTIKEMTEEYTHTPNKNLLDTHFGAPASELLQGLTVRKEIDYKTEFLKLEKDYFEDVADLKEEVKKADQEIKDLNEKLKERTDGYQYWYKEWQKTAQENKKLNMLIAKIVEIAEG